MAPCCDGYSVCGLCFIGECPNRDKFPKSDWGKKLQRLGAPPKLQQTADKPNWTEEERKRIIRFLDEKGCC